VFKIACNSLLESVSTRAKNAMLKACTKRTKSLFPPPLVGGGLGGEGKIAPHPSPPPHAGEGILLALNAFLANLPPSSFTSPDFWVKLRKSLGE
jgi:hypothetical protein